MVSDKYKKHWAATNHWLNEHAPKWVIDVVVEGQDRMMRVSNRWIYIGLIHEAALKMISMECDGATIPTPRIKRIREFTEASDRAAKKMMLLVDEDMMPNPQQAVKSLMVEVHGEEFAEAVSAEIQRRKNNER